MNVQLDLQELWSEIWQQLWRDVEAVAVIDEKLAEMLTESEAGRKEEGRCLGDLQPEG